MLCFLANFLDEIKNTNSFSQISLAFNRINRVLEEIAFGIREINELQFYLGFRYIRWYQSIDPAIMPPRRQQRVQEVYYFWGI